MPNDINGDKPFDRNAEGKVQATKFDGTKVQTSLFPVRAYLATCKVFTYGGQKYSIGNWKEGDGFKYTRLLNAMDRHIKAFQMGEDKDNETGMPHLAHAMCCLAMLLEACETNTGIDDRTEGQIVDPGAYRYDMNLPIEALNFLKTLEEMQKANSKGGEYAPKEEE